MNMKSRISLIGVLSFAISALVIIGACNKFDAPTAIWNANQAYAPGAVISEILPANSAIAGVREITIVGKSFSKVADSNLVWFGAQQAIVKSVSINAAADTLVFYRPSNSGQSTLKVIIPAADSIGMTSYGLESPISTSDISSIPSTNLVMEAGKNDTMWIGSWISSAAGCYVYELSPNGVDISVFKDSSYLKPKINKKATDFAQNFVDMKFGPGGFLYATFNKANTIYCLDPDSSPPRCTPSLRPLIAMVILISTKMETCIPAKVTDYF